MGLTDPLLGKSKEEDTAGEEGAPTAPTAFEPDAHTHGTVHAPLPPAIASGMLELCSACKEKIPINCRYCAGCGAPNGHFKATSGEEAGPSTSSIFPLEAGPSTPSMFLVQLPPGAHPGQTLQATVPQGLPNAGHVVTFKVPEGATAGQQVNVPLDTQNAPVSPGCFRVRLPPNFLPNQILEVFVPAGFPQSGMPTRFKAPDYMRAGQCIDVPLPPLGPTCAGANTSVPLGMFRVRLPLTAKAGSTLKVTVPQGYQQAGREQIFQVPLGAPPGCMVDVPLPGGGAFRAGVYDPKDAVAASHAAATHGAAVRGVPTSDYSPAPDTTYADPPVKDH